jgi:hypothetical protein
MLSGYQLTVNLNSNVQSIDLLARIDRFAKRSNHFHKDPQRKYTRTTVWWDAASPRPSAASAFRLRPSLTRAAATDSEPVVAPANPPRPVPVPASKDLGRVAAQAIPRQPTRVPGATDSAQAVAPVNRQQPVLVPAAAMDLVRAVAPAILPQPAPAPVVTTDWEPAAVQVNRRRQEQNGHRREAVTLR